MDTKKLRQKILDLAIHGKLVPQDPNDEPASVLLERIRAEKERLIKEGKIKKSKASKTSDMPHYENVPFEVPKGWCWCRLDCVGEIVTGSTPSKDNVDYYGGSIPFYKPTDLEQGINTIKASDSLTELGFSVSRQLPGQSILVTCIGATIGKTGLIQKRGTCNQQINAIISNNMVLPEYLYYTCISGYMQSEIIGRASATTLPILNKNKFSEIPIPVPPIQEQQRIISKIETLFSFVIELGNSEKELISSISIAKLKILDLAIHGKLVPQDANDEPASELLKRINPDAEITCDNGHYKYVFPMYWELTKLEDVCEFIRNGVSIRQTKGANGLPITRIETISNGIVDRDRMGYADIEDDTYERYYLRNGDILMSHINSPIHVGKSALYESIEGEKIIHGMNLLCLRMKTEICPKYMNFLFTSEYFRDEIQPYIKNAVNQASINTRNLGSICTPIPPYNEQLRIVSKIEELFAVLDEIQKSIEA